MARSAETKSMARSAEQRARNESIFREANEKLERKVVRLSITESRTPYFCECDDPGCRSVVNLTIREYEAVRSEPTQFLITPGHDAPPDRIVEEREGFTVIEKTGKEAELVEQQDPRSASSGA
jgi:hypothetical protein